MGASSLVDGRRQVRLGPGPLRIRIEGVGAENLREFAEREGLVLASDDEEAELIARAAPGGGAGGSARDRHPLPLSPRETEILEYLADGWSNAEIASVLRIGERTVRFHLEGLYAKLDVSRRGEAVREAFLQGLVKFEV